MPISIALSTDTTSSRILIVSSSTSTRLTLMSPAMMMPLSSTRSRMSARPSGRGAAGAKPRRSIGARRDEIVGSVIADPSLLGLRTDVALQPPVACHGAVAVDVDLVDGQDVGRLRDPARLDHLHLDVPAVLVPFDPDDSFGRLSDQ